MQDLIPYVFSVDGWTMFYHLLYHRWSRSIRSSSSRTSRNAFQQEEICRQLPIRKWQKVSEKNSSLQANELSFPKICSRVWTYYIHIHGKFPKRFLT